MNVRRIMRAAPFLLLLGACSPDDRGALKPVAATGVALVSTHGLPDDTARLVTDKVRADVTGRWSNTNESIEITYAATRAATLPIVSTATWKGAAARASAAWDVSAKEPGNVMGRPLLGTAGVRLAAGERRTVQIVYDRPVGAGGERPRRGDDVTMTIPMPGGPRAVIFRLAGE